MARTKKKAAKKKVAKKPTQEKMVHQPEVRRLKKDTHPKLDEAAAALDEARTARLSAGDDEKTAEKTCNDLMSGFGIDTYQLADGRILTYGPKGTMGCKIAKAPEDEHAPANGNLELVE